VRASLSLGEQAMGYGHDVASDARVADDFLVVGDEWRLREVEVFAYQIGAGAGNPTVTSVNLRVWDGPPGAPTSRVLHGDDVTNRMTAAAWDQLYRVDEPSLTSTNRAVYRITCTVPWWALPEGHYWLDWQTDGSLSGGPYVPPVSIPGQTHPPGANALQRSAGSWSPIQDPGSLTPDDFKFVIRGLRAGTDADLLDPTKG
jgi:hypothetical protein